MNILEKGSFSNCWDCFGHNVSVYPSSFFEQWQDSLVNELCARIVLNYVSLINISQDCVWHAPEPVYFFVSDTVCMSGTVYAYKYVHKCVCVCV